MDIALSTNINALVCRFVIIAVGMSHGYSLHLRGSIKLGMKEGLGSPIMVFVTLGVVGILFTCGGGTTIVGNVIGTDI